MQVIYGGMPPDVAEKSIQLFGREVVPAVHEMGVAAPSADAALGAARRGSSRLRGGRLVSPERPEAARAA